MSEAQSENDLSRGEAQASTESITPSPLPVDQTLVEIIQEIDDVATWFVYEGMPERAAICRDAHLALLSLSCRVKELETANRGLVRLCEAVEARAEAAESSLQQIKGALEALAEEHAFICRQYGRQPQQPYHAALAALSAEGQSRVMTHKSFTIVTVPAGGSFTNPPGGPVTKIESKSEREIALEAEVERLRKGLLQTRFMLCRRNRDAIRITDALNSIEVALISGEAPPLRNNNAHPPLIFRNPPEDNFDGDKGQMED